MKKQANAGSRAEVKKRDEKIDIVRDDELRDLRILLDQPAFRRFVWRYLKVCSVFKTTFTGDTQTFFNEGRRDIGCRLLADVTDARAEAYVEMMNEAKDTEGDQ